jgi:hypothetical protein
MSTAHRGSQLSAFVMMPFRPKFVHNYETVIAPALETCGLQSQLAPNIQESRDIMSNIYQGIWNSRLVVADLTGLNANVFYELGIASTLNKQVLLLTQDMDQLPFDLRRDRVLKYEDTAGGRAKLGTELVRETEDMLQKEWTSVPSWKEHLNADILSVQQLLSMESKVSQAAWIIEPEESFQDTAFHEIILQNLSRGIRYKFIVGDRPDVEQAFRNALKSYYGKQAQIVYVPEARLEIPLSLAIFDPTSPMEKGYQYLPNGVTIYGLPFTRPSLMRARRLFISTWQMRDFRIAGKRNLSA